jgi:hypothetical protein
VNQPNLAVRTRDSYIFNPSGTDVNTATQQPAPVLKKKLASNEQDDRLRNQ